MTFSFTQKHIGMHTGGAAGAQEPLELSSEILIIKQRLQWNGKFSIFIRLWYFVCE